MPSRKRHMIILLTTIALAAIGSALALGGAWLVAVAGSFFYLFGGVMFLVTACLLHRRKSTALWVYGGFVFCTLLWAVWEVGFDWWQLGPRGGVIIIIGIWLLTPWVREKLYANISGRASAWALGIPILFSIAAAAYAMTSDPHDHAGSLPTDRIAAGSF